MDPWSSADPSELAPTPHQVGRLRMGRTWCAVAAAGAKWGLGGCRQGEAGRSTVCDCGPRTTTRAIPCPYVLRLRARDGRWSRVAGVRLTPGGHRRPRAGRGARTACARGPRTTKGWAPCPYILRLGARDDRWSGVAGVRIAPLGQRRPRPTGRRAALAAHRFCDPPADLTQSACALSWAVVGGGGQTRAHADESDPACRRVV